MSTFPETPRRDTNMIPQRIDIRLVQITDTNGSVISHIPEPLSASIVMVAGAYGNAWQRHGNDGLWHSTTGAVRRWSQMLRMRNLVLVYDAPEREVECEHGFKGCDARGTRHYHVEVQR